MSWQRQDALAEFVNVVHISYINVVVWGIYIHWPTLCGDMSCSRVDIIIAQSCVVSCGVKMK